MDVGLDVSKESESEADNSDPAPALKGLMVLKLHRRHQHWQHVPLHTTGDTEMLELVLKHLLRVLPCLVLV